MPMLFAERDGTALALACSTGWSKRSVGFVGVSDGWQDLSQHSRMEWTYRLPAGARLDFTFRWVTAGRWEGRDFTIAAAVSAPSCAESPR